MVEEGVGGVDRILDLLRRTPALGRALLEQPHRVAVTARDVPQARLLDGAADAELHVSLSDASVPGGVEDEDGVVGLLIVEAGAPVDACRHRARSRERAAIDGGGGSQRCSQLGDDLLLLSDVVEYGIADLQDPLEPLTRHLADVDLRPLLGSSNIPLGNGCATCARPVHDLLKQVEHDLLDAAVVLSAICGYLQAGSDEIARCLDTGIPGEVLEPLERARRGEVDDPRPGREQRHLVEVAGVGPHPGEALHHDDHAVVGHEHVVVLASCVVQREGQAARGVLPARHVTGDQVVRDVEQAVLVGADVDLDAG